MTKPIDHHLDRTLSESQLAEPQGVTLSAIAAIGAAQSSTPAAADAAPPARAQLGRFEIHGEIGRGAMGAVLRGRDPALGRDLAIKVLLAHRADNADVLRRFNDEARIGGQLQHPGLVPVYELGADGDGRPFFAMKLVDGRTLASLLKERPSPAAELPHFLTIDMVTPHLVTGFSYLPRQVGNNGHIKGWEFYVSKDGIAWGNALKTGNFPDVTTLQTVVF